MDFNPSMQRSADDTTAGWTVLVLSRHAPQAASSRLRTHQYIPSLQAAGARVSVAPFFDERYLSRLYETRQRRIWDVVRAYRQRFAAMTGLRRASVIWIEKEVFPYFPAIFESLPARLGVPYAVDYDDATFHTYDKSSNAMVRGLLARKLETLIGGAGAITAGNAYVESYVRAHGARNVLRVPTVVDLTRYEIRPEPATDEIRIGWIGTPATMHYLQLVRDPLRVVASTRNIRLVTVGARPLGDFGVPLEQHSWSEDSEAALLSTCHIGVMPLPDESWERGKSGYKLIQYMASGRPVIASPVGANCEIVSPDVGILASGSAAWTQALTTLIDDGDLRRRLGAGGRARVEANYSLQVTAPKVCTLLSTLAGER